MSRRNYIFKPKMLLIAAGVCAASILLGYLVGSITGLAEIITQRGALGIVFGGACLMLLISLFGAEYDWITVPYFIVIIVSCLAIGLYMTAPKEARVALEVTASQGQLLK